MTSHFAVIGMGGISSMTRAFGNIMPNASRMPNRPPEAPTVGMAIWVPEKYSVFSHLFLHVRPVDVRPLAAPDHFHRAGGHPQAEHVEEQMRKAGMQEAVR